jgi:hypothetical protein
MNMKSKKLLTFLSLGIWGVSSALNAQVFEPNLPGTRFVLSDKRTSGGLLKATLIWKSGGSAYSIDPPGMWAVNGWGQGLLIDAFGLAEYDLKPNRMLMYAKEFNRIDNSSSYRAIQYFYRKDMKNACTLFLDQDWTRINNGTESRIDITLMGCQDINWPK